MKIYLKTIFVALLIGLSIANKPMTNSPMTFEIAKGICVTVNGPIKETTTIDENGNTIKAWIDESGNVYTKPVEAFDQNRPRHRRYNVFHGGTHTFYNGKHREIILNKMNFAQRLSQCIEEIKNASWSHGNLEKAAKTAFETLKEAEKANTLEADKIINWAERIVYNIKARLYQAHRGFYAVNSIPVHIILHKIVVTYGSAICSNNSNTCKLIADIMAQANLIEQYENLHSKNRSSK